MRGRRHGAKRRRSGFSTERSNCGIKECGTQEQSLPSIQKDEARKEKEGDVDRKGKYNKNNVKTIFWNVAGTAKLKAEDWNYVKGFDIIGLAETWEEPGRGRRSDLILDGYEVRLKYAVRDKKKEGRKGVCC